MRVVHCKKERYSHYIGRPSIFGNPFSHQTDTKAGVIVATREDAIDEFEVYARTTPQVLNAIRDLPEDAVLGCWCHPRPCHGDVIIKIWKELHGHSHHS